MTSCRGLATESIPRSSQSALSNARESKAPFLRGRGPWGCGARAIAGKPKPLQLGTLCRLDQRSAARCHAHIGLRSARYGPNVISPTVSYCGATDDIHFVHKLPCGDG